MIEEKHCAVLMKILLYL